MNCDITLYRKEVKDKHKKDNTDSFFRDYNNLVKFSSKRKSEFKNKLFNSGFHLYKSVKGLLFFIHPDNADITVLLTSNYIYFTSPTSYEKEIRELALSFTEDGYLAKYNRQGGGWK